MNRLTLSLVAIATCMLSDGYTFGQTPQGHDGNQGDRQPDGVYHLTSGSNCQSCNPGGGHQVMHQQATQYCAPCDSRCAGWTRPLFPNNCAARCCATKAYPDAGWNPPTHMPVNYDGAWYGSYLPQHAYGTPGGGFIANHPTVYQPTDTTQLGYYYHKVPTWQSRANMIPPVPHPRDFHARVCPQGGTGCHGCQGVSYGAVSYGPASSSYQNSNSGHSAGTQQTSPNGPQVGRIAEPQRKGLFGAFRTVSLMEVFD